VTYIENAEKEISTVREGLVRELGLEPIGVGGKPPGRRQRSGLEGASTGTRPTRRLRAATDTPQTDVLRRVVVGVGFVLAVLTTEVVSPRAVSLRGVTAL
jgi:hypothetical protein